MSDVSFGADVDECFRAGLAPRNHLTRNARTLHEQGQGWWGFFNPAAGEPRTIGAVSITQKIEDCRKFVNAALEAAVYLRPVPPGLTRAELSAATETMGFRAGSKAEMEVGPLQKEVSPMLGISSSEWEKGMSE